MDRDRLRSWAIFLLRLVRWSLVVVFILLCLSFVKNVLLRPRIGCSSSVFYINPKDVDEIAGVVLQSLVENNTNSDGKFYAFEQPKGKPVRAWQYINGTFVRVDNDTLQTATSGYRIFVRFLHRNEISVCVDPVRRGFEHISGSETYIWNLERQSGEWKVTLKMPEFWDRDMKPLP